MTPLTTVVEPITSKLSPVITRRNRPERADDPRWSLDEPALTIPKATAAVVKSVICRLIAACPCWLWAPLSALVRRIWPGFESA